MQHSLLPSPISLSHTNHTSICQTHTNKIDQNLQKFWFIVGISWFSSCRMKFNLLSQRIFMARPYLGPVLERRRYAFSTSASAPTWEGGVSMVQGASRGIGLEFVSLLSFSLSLYLFLLCYKMCVGINFYKSSYVWFSDIKIYHSFCNELTRKQVSHKLSFHTFFSF